MFVPIIIIRFHVEFASPQYPSIKCGRCCNSINLSAETLPTLTMQVVSCRPISWCLPGVVGSQPLIEDILKAIEVNNLVTYNSQLLHQAEFRLSATLDHHLKMRFWAQTIKVSEGCCGFCPWNAKCHHLSSASFQPTDFWPRLCRAFTLFWCYLSPFLTLWIYHSARWPADPWINPRLEKKNTTLSYTFVQSTVQNWKTFCKTLWSNKSWPFTLLSQWRSSFTTYFVHGPGYTLFGNEFWSKNPKFNTGRVMRGLQIISTHIMT